MTQQVEAQDQDRTVRQAAGIRKTAMFGGGIALGMLGLAYASVPLYDLFCRVTGFGGTPMVRETEAGKVLDRTIRVRLDANVAPGLAWRFTPETPEIELRIGETRTVAYTLTNTGAAPATGIATYNVYPPTSGGYFVKIQCFCFTDRTLAPGETQEAEVVFYVDPEIAKDKDLQKLNTITLSYTFFPSRAGKPLADAGGTTPRL
jgi:cytochrome c oxidase assembly protein subunit 11